MLNESQRMQVISELDQTKSRIREALLDDQYHYSIVVFMHELFQREKARQQELDPDGSEVVNLEMPLCHLLFVLQASQLVIGEFMLEEEDGG